MANTGAADESPNQIEAVQASFVRRFVLAPLDFRDVRANCLDHVGLEIQP